jgi:DNA-binding CsgD family transcriptional regulator
MRRDPTVSRGLPRCVVCKEQAAFAERMAVPVDDGTPGKFWVHHRCAPQLAVYLLVNTLPGERSGRPARAIERSHAIDRAGLTERELRVLRCLANGYTNQQIAQELEVKHKTARNIVSSVLAKLDAVNRAEAVAIATREGLLD